MVVIIALQSTLHSSLFFCFKMQRASIIRKKNNVLSPLCLLKKAIKATARQLKNILSLAVAFFAFWAII